jgi:hypothetical protein
MQGGTVATGPGIERKQCVIDSMDALTIAMVFELRVSLEFSLQAYGEKHVLGNCEKCEESLWN